MEVRFVNADLERLETDPEFNGGFSREIVRAYRKVMQIIRSAADERDLYAMRSLHFEKLKGDRAGQRSLRLNDQWRLIVTVASVKPKKATDAKPKNVIKIHEIVDYH